MDCPLREMAGRSLQLFASEETSSCILLNSSNINAAVLYHYHFISISLAGHVQPFCVACILMEFDSTLLLFRGFLFFFSK